MPDQNFCSGPAFSLQYANLIKNQHTELLHGKISCNSAVIIANAVSISIELG